MRRIKVRSFPNYLYRSFDYFMILVIFLNSLTLSLYDYGDRDSVTYNNQMIDKANTYFTCVFIFEACLKIIAQGLVMH